MNDPQVSALLESCPFLLTHYDQDDLNLPTIIFGATARLLISRTLRSDQEDLVFAYFNRLADQGIADEILGTGAIELFNDGPGAQQLARAKLTGRALEMLEQFREFWGQPDYGQVA